MNMITKFHMLTFDHSFLLLSGWRVRCWLGSPWRKLCPSLSRVGSSSNWFRLNKEGEEGSKEARPANSLLPTNILSWWAQQSSNCLLIKPTNPTIALHQKGCFHRAQNISSRQNSVYLDHSFVSKNSKKQEKGYFFLLFCSMHLIHEYR